MNTARSALHYRNEPARLSDEFIKLRTQKEEHEEKVRKLNIDIAAHEQELVEWFESAGLTQFKTDDGATIFIKDEPYSSVEDRTKFIDWIKEQGMEDILSVHFQTMNSMVKDRLSAGQPEPPGVKVFIKTGINLRRN